MDENIVARLARLLSLGIGLLAVGLIGDIILHLLSLVTSGLNGFETVFNIIIIFGMFITGIALVSGLLMKHKEKNAVPSVLNNCRIISRFAISEANEMIFSDWEYNAPGGQLFIQAEIPGHGKREFHTSWPVFLQCGEGMVGTICQEGDWISSFVPIKNYESKVQGCPETLNDWDPMNRD